MAFIGMVIASIAGIIFIVLLAHMFIFIVIAIVLKIAGRKKDSRKMRTAGNVFLSLGIVCSLPVAAVLGYFIFNSLFEKVTLPDGSSHYISEKSIDELQALLDNGLEDPQKLDKILDKTPNLIYYYNVNRDGIIDYAMQLGSLDAVEIALEHGAVFDDPRKYEHMAYTDSSMDEFISSFCGGKVTNEDVEILKLMFEKGAKSDSVYKHDLYSNMLGHAAWIVLYNDESVTDTELELIHVITSNGITGDSNLILYEDTPQNIHLDQSFNGNVLKDDNYYELLEIVY